MLFVRGLSRAALQTMQTSNSRKASAAYSIGKLKKTKDYYRKLKKAISFKRKLKKTKVN